VKFFAGTIRANKVDAKGRVSVPAAFRKVLAAQESEGVYVFPSHRQPCLEACGEGRMEEYRAQIKQLPSFSRERQIWQQLLFGEAVPLEFDSNGRVMLPKEMMAEVGITSAATFAGNGDSFQIWEPDAHDEHRRNAKLEANEKQLELPDALGEGAL
jgi:MraZ protein